MQTPNQTQPVPYAEVEGVFTSIGMACVMLEESELPQAPRWLESMEAVAEAVSDTLDLWSDDPDCLPADFLDDPAKIFALSAMFTADELAAAAGAPLPGLSFAQDDKRRPHAIEAKGLMQLARVLTPLVARLRAIEIPEAQGWLAQVEPIAIEATDALQTTGTSLQALSVQTPAYSVLDVEALTKLRGDTTMSDALDDFRAKAKEAWGTK